MIDQLFNDPLHRMYLNGFAFLWLFTVMVTTHSPAVLVLCGIFCGFGAWSFLHAWDELDTQKEEERQQKNP